jgi:hypothetical protein
MAIRNRKSASNSQDDEYDDRGSPIEISTFKKGLRGISLDVIRERLDGQISRKWKRDLVEAELERRMEDEEVEDSAQENPAQRMRTRGWGRWAASAIIVGCSLIILYALFESWRG